MASRAGKHDSTYHAIAIHYGGPHVETKSAIRARRYAAQSAAQFRKIGQIFAGTAISIIIR
jgi:hypothetical protein